MGGACLYAIAWTDDLRRSIFHSDPPSVLRQRSSFGVTGPRYNGERPDGNGIGTLQLGVNLNHFQCWAGDNVHKQGHIRPSSTNKPTPVSKHAFGRHYEGWLWATAKVQSGRSLQSLQNWTSRKHQRQENYQDSISDGEGLIIMMHAQRFALEWQINSTAA